MIIAHMAGIQVFATGGIGGKTAEVLGQAGYEVIVTGIDEAGRNTVMSNLESKGIKAHFYKCDATSEEQVNETFAKIAEKFDHLDLLVNNVGGLGGRQRVSEMETGFMRKVMALTFDISADLEELAHTPVMVVCAGAKSILDLGLTLEYLETHGVPVIGYGTEELPAFYTRKSGFKVDYRIDTPAELAKAFYVKQDMGLGGGMLVTNPIPEEYSMDHEVINKAIDEAVAEANKLGIHGKETTPFLLAKIKDITGGDSLASNIQLVYNNAKLAAKTACELMTLAKN